MSERREIMATSLDKTIEKFTRQIINDYKREIKKDLIDVANYTNEEMYQTAIEMYDTFIEQYYDYPTTTYIRHGESKPGTQHGINLYRAQDIKKKSGDNPELTIHFSPSDMQGGYQHGTPEDVFQNVMNGIQGAPPYWFISWRGEYFGDYFSYSGDPARAFDVFEKNFIKIAKPIFMKRWDKIRKERGW